MRSSAGGVGRALLLHLGRRPPPLSSPRMVSGLMPKIQPPTSAITMVPMPMLRPPKPKPPPPPPPSSRRSSTLSDSRLPSHFMLSPLCRAILA
jgi:hypothetical protein